MNSNNETQFIGLKHFDKICEKAKCLHCPSKILSCSGGSTCSLRKHLVLVHDMNLEEGKEDAREDQETSLSKGLR